jgi:CRP-like cAMP-binding protein
MKPYRATKGSFIFKQGDEASLFFYIEQGSVKLLVNDEFKKNIA